MNLLIYAIVGLTVTWLLYLLYMQVATRAAEGRPAEPLYAAFPALATQPGRALVYCYSPQCGPCRPMLKEVGQLAAAGAPVFKLDITQYPEISRELGIRATPTLIVIEDQAVSRMLLGFRTADYMQGLIDSPTH